MTSPLYHLKRTLRFSALTMLAVLGLGFSALSAQEVRIDQFDGIDACQGTLTDEGGAAGNTTAGSSNMITICSNSGMIDETHIRLNFTTIAIDGTIDVYNGPIVDPATQIGIPIDPTANGTNLTFEASAANASGCLTIVTNFAGSSAGFEALISCTRACQPVIADLLSSEPAVMPADTGYIDVCVGDEIVFNGRGIYPEDGTIYNQSDLTSSFVWNFDDGETANTASTTHSYAEPGGYTVQLFITDINGCSNNNLISQRVRVSPTPTFNLQNDFVDVVCADDTLTLRGSTQFDPNENSELLITTEEQSFGASQILADTTFLPDGNGVAYQTTLQFNNFQAGQVLTDINDIVDVCLNMEHSYAGDLDLFLTCPNGSTVRFIDFGTGLGNTFLGVPVDVDADLSPGIGFDYCFVPDPSLQTIAEFNGTNNPATMPAGNYDAINPWEDLLGCPLNGDWTINIQDNLFSDNGYIFSWGITFNDALFPELETFTVGINEASFVETDDLLFFSADSIVALPNAAGMQQYTYAVTDDFGCTYDTTLVIEVLPVSAPECYDCQPLLIDILQEEMAGVGQTVQTELATENALFQDVAFRVAPVDPFGSSLFPSLGSAYVSPIEVNSIFPGGITDVNQSIVSICVTLESPTTGGIRLYAQAPDGTLLELSSGNGGNGSNYTQTCFTPSATTSITAGTPPFTGDFMPEGNFEDLNGVPTNGNWNLLAWDVSGSMDIGTFVSWSITLRNENNITYSWTPDNGTLSCTDCPDPVITVDGITDTYTVVATDSYGCTETGTVLIVANLDVEVDITGTNVSCNGAMDGTAVATASGGVPPYTFEWSNEATGDTLTNLGPGTYIVTVTDANETTASDTIVITEPDVLEFVSITVVDIDCAGNDNGSIEVEVAGGTPPYVIEPADLNNLAAGTYEISVTDTNGCVATVSVDVATPEALELNAVVTDVTCGGEDDGAIDLTVTGGTGEYTYEWSNEAETEDLSDLDGGMYSVTVTDENNCTTTLTVTVDEASTLEASLLLNDLTCFEDNTGSIELTVTGGVAPYTYLWSNGDTTATITELPAGTYTGTATDAAGCTISTPEITISQPEELVCEVEVVQEPSEGDNGILMATVEGGTPDYTYQWDDPTAQTTATATGLESGTYCVTITDANGCETVCCAELQAFATVGDFVFLDDNRDGIQDAEDLGISNATVIINSVDGSFTETTTTDADGFYSFLVAPGDYTLTFANPGGLLASPANQGGDDEADSDINQNTLTTATIALGFNEENFSIDAGFFDPCTPGLTSAGTIGFDQTLCGPGNAPDELVQLTPATGGTGTLNYIWMMTTGDPTAPIQNWTPIQNTNTLNYQPGVLYESTYFTRCVRQDECPYIESNVIMIEVGDDATANLSGPTLVCEGETVTYSAGGANPANISWSVTGTDVVNVNPNGSVDVLWPSFGNFTITLTNVENGCIASNFLNVGVSNSQDNCFNSIDTPGTGLETANLGSEALLQGPLARVFPNPAFASEVQLQLLRAASDDDKQVQVDLYNATGSRVATQLLEAGPQQVSLKAFSQQPAGLYLVRVTQDGETETHRVVLR